MKKCIKTNNSEVCSCWRGLLMSKLSSQCTRTFLLLDCQLLCGGLIKAAAHWCRSHKPAPSNTNDLFYGYQASGTTGENRRRRSWWAVFTRRSSPFLPFNSISACWHAAYHVTTLNSAVNNCQQIVSEIFTSRIWPLYLMWKCLVMTGSRAKHTLYLGSSTSP